MRHTAKDHYRGCGCRSVGECFHDPWLTADRRARNALVDDLAAAMKRKLGNKSCDKSGWDAEDWSIEDIKRQLIAHVEKGDPVDVANFAAFWFNKVASEG